MKNIKTLAVAAVLGLAICGFAIAQGRHGGAGGHGAPHHFKDAAAAVEHITETFAKFASFDANKDGQLDATETETLAKAVVAGIVQLPTHTPPIGVKPSAEMMLNHLRGVYACFAKYDANRDGTLDATEQATLKSAIEKGEFVCPLGQYPCGAGGPGR
jgi:EF hand